jgi:hypothetical protein
MLWLGGGWGSGGAAMERIVVFLIIGLNIKITIFFEGN